MVDGVIGIYYDCPPDDRQIGFGLLMLLSALAAAAARRSRTAMHRDFTWVVFAIAVAISFVIVALLGGYVALLDYSNRKQAGRAVLCAPVNGQAAAIRDSSLRWVFGIVPTLATVALFMADWRFVALLAVWCLGVWATIWLVREAVLRGCTVEIRERGVCVPASGFIPWNRITSWSRLEEDNVPARTVLRLSVESGRPVAGIDLAVTDLEWPRLMCLLDEHEVMELP